MTNASIERRAEALLSRCADGEPLTRSRRGVEKESLRVTPGGQVARTPHPAALGSALCHPWITTDYSEALLEFITPPCADVDSVLGCLSDIHRFTYHNIGDELLWATSMPCVVEGDAGIPIAEYGSSNVGRMKHVYRRGLDWRYGRAMQAISGIHFNYSFAPEILAALCGSKDVMPDDRTLRSTAYFAVTRNFQRYGWIVPYLFGASPAICKSFTGGKNLHFEEHGKHTFYEPWATSLRMSDIGYKNNAQAALNVSYNSLDEYVDSLRRAISTPDPDYERIGTFVDGEWRQLNTHMLQIENEYYSFVRPKAVAQSGEKPTTALKRAGVEYVEIRALDLNPFEAVGLGREQLLFLEVLLLFCLLEESPVIDAREQGCINRNQGLVARRGRDPSLQLSRGGGSQVSLTQWAEELFEGFETAARLLDRAHGSSAYREMLSALRRRVRFPGETPSARVLAALQEEGEEFVQFAIRVSREHRERFLAEPLRDDVYRRFVEAAESSLLEQRRIEESDELSFEEYLAAYFKRG